MKILTKKTEKLLSLQYAFTLGRIILILALSRTQIIGTYPFGIAYAAFFAEDSVFAALFALSLGALTAGKAVAAKYILAALIYSVTVYFRKFRDLQIKSVALGVALIIASLSTLHIQGATLSRIISIAPEAFAVGGLFYLFSTSEKQGILVYCRDILLAGACLGGIYGISLPYIDADIAVMVGMLIIMCVSYSCGVPAAVLTGTVIGFMIFIDSPDAIEISGMFALSAALAAAISKTGKAGVSTGFLSGMTVSILSMGRLGALSVGDIFTAPIIFLLLPESFSVKIGEYIKGIFHNENYGKESGIITDQLQTVARAVEDLGCGVKILSASHTDKSDPFAALPERVCADCRIRGYCQVNTDDLIKTLEKDGFLNSSNAPYSFEKACLRPEKYMTEFAHIYELDKQNELFKGEAVYDRNIALNQYEEISNIIKNLSRIISDRTESGIKRERYNITVSVYQEPRKGQEINGDTVVHFKRGNKYFVIICDGMGSGKAARDISSLSARLFAEFLASGIDKKSAVSIINSALALSADRESFSSADILELDLAEGYAEFLKIGSAQSFIKRGGEVAEVSSSALPIGILENIEVTPQYFDLSQIDLILMVSDGISEAASGVIKNEWIKKILLSDTASDAEKAKCFVDGAKARTAYSDDMTSVVIKIK